MRVQLDVGLAAVRFLFEFLVSFLCYARLARTEKCLKALHGGDLN